jgi:macrodomain Ter protein organizer (MatP/YcbG family)
MAKQPDDTKTADLLDTEPSKRGRPRLGAEAQTATQRQAAYRARRKALGEGGKSGDRRLSVWLSYDAHASLTRLAGHRGMSQRELLEALLTNLDKETAKQLDESQLAAYYR